MNERKSNSNFISILIFINSLIIIGLLAFFGYKFSQNEYSHNYYPPSNEMIEMCRSSAFCLIDDNSSSDDLLSALAGKPKTNNYDFTLIVGSIPQINTNIDPIPDPEMITGKEKSYSSAPLENWQPHLVEIVEVQRKYETLGDYCHDAELCLSKKNVSLDELKEAIKSIGLGRKTIKFYMREVVELK